MGYYPIFVELKDRECLVVGGGHEAEKKASGLLAADGRVTVVSPELGPEMQKLLDAGQIRWIPRVYLPGDMVGFELVMVATDDGLANKEIYREGRGRKIWVNAADDTPNCDFILPAVIRKGQVTIAASTSGASPALARRLREELTDYFSDDIPALADLLGEVRTELRRRKIPVDNETWQRAIDGPLRALLVQRRYDEARARLLDSLGVTAALASNGAGEA